MQGCAFSAGYTAQQKFILTPVSTHLSIRVEAHSRRFLWLHYGADQDVCNPCAETTTRHVWCVCVSACVSVH